MLLQLFLLIFSYFLLFHLPALNDNLIALNNTFRFEGGEIEAKVSNSSNGETTQVSFANPFDNPPLVLVNKISGAAALSVVARNVTKKGFTIYGYYNVTSTVTTRWIAIGR